MNKSFRVIFQAASGTFVAVSELARSNGKTKSSRMQRRAATILGALALSAGMASGNASAQPLSQKKQQHPYVKSRIRKILSFAWMMSAMPH